jgi:hypothetical protein
MTGNGSESCGNYTHHILREKFLKYLIAGLAKSGTTILFSRLQQAIDPAPATYFEPDTDTQLQDILDQRATAHTLAKVLIGRVTSKNTLLGDFDRHILIYRDPRDQFISMLLYLFYDFQEKGDHSGFEQAKEALERKIKDPTGHSTVELYNLLAVLVGRAPIAVFNNLHREQQAYIDAFSPYLLRYEDFVDGDLEAVEQYVGLSLRNNAQVPDIYNRVARSKAYGEWKNWLNERDLEHINEEWGNAIQALGYSLQSIPAELSIRINTSLDYISQFDPVRRQAGSVPDEH